MLYYEDHIIFSIERKFFMTLRGMNKLIGNIESKQETYRFTFHAFPNVSSNNLNRTEVRKPRDSRQLIVFRKC